MSATRAREIRGPAFVASRLDNNFLASAGRAPFSDNALGMYAARARVLTTGKPVSAH